MRLTLENYEPTPMEQWGKDHWSTLVYVETRVVDHHGRVAMQHLRTDYSRHPSLVGYLRDDGTMRPGNTHLAGSSHGRYPTRLRGWDGTAAHTRDDHDDFDCIVDMVAAGLVRIVAPMDAAFWDIAPGRRGPLSERQRVARVLLTHEGFRVSGAVREWRGNGGSYATFEAKVQVA